MAVDTLRTFFLVMLDRRLNGAPRSPRGQGPAHRVPRNELTVADPLHQACLRPGGDTAYYKDFEAFVTERRRIRIDSRALCRCHSEAARSSYHFAAE
jgi:hypothetical protein